MLAVNSYPKDYVEGCRVAMDRQLDAYRELVATAKAQAKKVGPIDAAVEAFDSSFFNNLVLVLDAYFLHRQRSLEGKDGNPVNEVRVLCGSILQNGGKMGADKTIKMKPAESILHYEVGDEIQIGAEDFTRLADAYFAEIAARYPA